MYKHFIHDLPSACADRIALDNGFMKLSASELACGHRGVILQWSIPFSLIYSLIYLLVNGGPLSLCITCGMPCVEKILSIFGMMELADVE